MTSPSALECKGSVAGSHEHTDLWRKRQISCVSRWVRGGKKNPFGSCFLLHECMCREFVLSVFRAESLQPAMRMVWSHICLAERALGFSWNPSFSSCSSHFRKNMICCENENKDAVAHRAVVINWGERKAAPPNKHTHTMTWLCPLAEGGKEEKGETGFTLCAPLRHPESTQVEAVQHHCQTYPKYTSPTPRPLSLW